MGPFLQDALNLLGPDYVIKASEVLRQYEQATFTTEQKIPAVLLPGNVTEVAKIVRLANDYRIPIYPTSRGRNWGLGSRVPVQSGQCVIDLQRMNRILDFDAELGSLTVEPGVTFQQAVDFLKDQHSDFLVSTIGGPPEASLLANALERGDGLGPLGDRARFCCIQEAILPTGECIRTGLNAFDGSLSRHLSPSGPGPAIEGLFFQSNLAIVTKMSILLWRRPPHFQAFSFFIESQDQLIQVNREIRQLQQLGVVGPTAFSLWNMYRFLSTQMTYPWSESGEKETTPEEILQQLPKSIRSCKWVGFVFTYAPTRLIQFSQKRKIKRALKPHAHKLIAVDPISAFVMRLARKPLRRLFHIDVDTLLTALHDEPVFLGNTTTPTVSSIYWRKRTPAPASWNPERDRCGISWICSAVPYDGTHIARVTDLVETIALEHRLEPMCMFFNMNQWYLKTFIVILYDQEIPEEDARAKSCHDRILDQLAQEGYTPVRLGIQSMDFAPDDPAYLELIQKLKGTLDPNDILAPGRYDFRRAWQN